VLFFGNFYNQVKVTFLFTNGTIAIKNVEDFGF
jgi:hypothetical protein